eukprot:800973_1
MLLVFLLTLIQYSIAAEYDLGLACRYVEYCLVSYCIGLGGHGVPTWKCPACKRYFPDVNSDNVTVFKTGFSDYDIHAYVAYEPNMPEIIIAFEGTEPLSITDWIDDLEYYKENYPLSDCGTTPPCQVHTGFFDTYNAIRLPLWKTAMQYLDYFGHDTPIHITGHSLGSSLATHCALDGALNYNRTYDYVYTFGPPRVGDANFAHFYNKLIPYHYRVTHHKDPVPQLPEAWMQNGFRHIYHEVYYEKDPNGTYKVCDGSGEDPTCRDKYGLDLIHVTDHLDYLGFDFTTNEIECKV